VWNKIEWWKVKKKKKRDEFCVYDNEWMVGCVELSWVELMEWLLGLRNQGGELLFDLLVVKPRQWIIT
jgi:hypothetical protein